MSQEPPFTVQRDGQGGFVQVPTSQINAAGGASKNASLNSFFDTAQLGMNPDPDAYSDQFKLEGLPDFTFRIRMVSAKIMAYDDGFTLRCVDELGLREKVLAALERSGAEDRSDEAIENEAIKVVMLETFRVWPHLSARYDELLKERYLSVIIGDTTSVSTADWGGLVTWISSTLPYSVENVKAANVRLLVQLYTRIMAYSRGGVDDASFRRANNTVRR